MTTERYDVVLEAVNQALHGSTRPCRTACTHFIVGTWTALGIANVIARHHKAQFGDPAASASHMETMPDPYGLPPGAYC